MTIFAFMENLFFSPVFCVYICKNYIYEGAYTKVIKGGTIDGR